jgi:DNA-binding transcriptional MerR regulator
MEKHNVKGKSIGIVSKEIGVDSHVIRFWEKEFPQIRPQNIGKNGRRVYYDGDVENIFKIKYFLYESGYTIAGLKMLLQKNKSLIGKNLTDIKEMTKIGSNNETKIDKEEYRFEILAKMVKIQDKLRMLVLDMNRSFKNI